MENCTDYSDYSRTIIIIPPFKSRLHLTIYKPHMTEYFKQRFDMYLSTLPTQLKQYRVLVINILLHKIFNWTYIERTLIKQKYYV